ncbi:MAG: hypothetical protein A3C35_08640 [Omnitrophica bacterium RIFCSPHIGHO2_02_FULL_46_11]|nr:MAG: hypothetical protein A3C35_08640 [Omnitrophica bacterium RIFCSPHIGHO2_02_FULL_46_11]
MKLARVRGRGIFPDPSFYYSAAFLGYQFFDWKMILDGNGHKKGRLISKWKPSFLQVKRIA